MDSIFKKTSLFSTFAVLIFMAGSAQADDTEPGFDRV
jgi:hypothetical protein